MFRIIYAKSVEKDLRHISPPNLLKIKSGIESLEKFPNLPQIKQLKIIRLQIIDYAWVIIGFYSMSIGMIKKYTS